MNFWKIRAMDQNSQAFKATEITTDENVLALSWNIATEPKLYRELVSNPYSLTSLNTISERFPDEKTSDIIRAVVMAEPEGRYDRIFKQLSQDLQEVELYIQSIRAAQINKRLNDYYSQHGQNLRELPSGSIYDILFIIAFETTNLLEVEEKYRQNQRRDIRLSIVNYIEKMRRPTLDPLQEDDSKTAAIMDFTKKPAVGRSLLKVAFVALSAVMLFYLANGLYERQVGNVQTRSTPQYSEGNNQILGIKTQKENQSLPMRLKIPSINVDAAIQYVGLTSKGAMEVPNNIVDVGWFDLGSRPGENGSAVIAGHFNGENGKAGVFSNLHKLKVGDKFYIEDNYGATISFVVRASRAYDPGYADDVFSRNDSAHLNLITCDGVWDEAKKTYSKRLVVFADAIY